VASKVLCGDKVTIYHQLDIPEEEQDPESTVLLFPHEDAADVSLLSLEEA
jgi:hypothetical protein